MRYLLNKFTSILIMSVALATLAHADTRFSDEPYVAPINLDATASEAINKEMATTLKIESSYDFRYKAVTSSTVGQIKCQQPADKDGKIVVGSKITCSVQPMTTKEMQENICPPSDSKGDASSGVSH